jgi:hypothetical protein
VDTGNPKIEDSKTVVAPPKSTENARTLFNSVIELPIVLMTFFPNIMPPTAIPRPPNINTQIGIDKIVPTDPVLITVKINANGAIALATSLLPCENYI